MTAVSGKIHDVIQLTAPAKINLALVVGPLRANGKHEVVTVYQRVDLADTLSVEPAAELVVEGFAGDTIVGQALELLAAEAGAAHRWRVRLDKRIPVAAGLGGGSADAAAALRGANDLLEVPLPEERLRTLAAGVGADVPFFLTKGPQLGTGDGSTLGALSLPQGYAVLLLVPERVEKESTAAVYAAFDRRGGGAGFVQRRALLLDVLDRVREARDLAALPANDLASSPLCERLCALGAFRADVSGAGPTVYALFHDAAAARAAADEVGSLGETVITAPCW